MVPSKIHVLNLCSVVLEFDKYLNHSCALLVLT